MCAPRGHGVAVRAGAAQYFLPKSFNCGGIAEAGENLARPVQTGHRRDAPLVFVLHRVSVRLRHLEPLPLSLRPFVVIHTGKPIRVVGVEIYVCGKRLHAPGEALLFPRLHPAEDVLRLIFYVQPLCRLKAPLKKDLGRAREVAFLHQHFNEFKLLRRGAYHNLLPRLHIHAHARNERRV